MKNTKLVEILMTFSEDEMKDLKKFVESPYHRKRDLGDLFNVLRQFHPGFDDAKLTNEYVFSRLFPGKKFGDRKSDSLLKTLTSELFSLCKEFLIQLGLREKENYRTYFLLGQLRKRKLLPEFMREAGPALEFIEKDTGNNFDLIEKSYLCSAFVEYYIDTNEFDKCYEMIIRQHENVLASALISMLRFSSQQTAAEDGYNLTTRKNLNQSLMKHIDAESFIEELRHDGSRYAPYMEINYTGHLVHTSKQNDRSLFFRMKKLLDESRGILSKQEMYIFYSMTAAYGNKIFSGANETRHRDKVLELYKIMINEDAYKFSPEDHFQIGLFRSMLISSRVAGDFEWMKMLIDNYLKELHPKYADNMRSYAMGQYYFGIREYGKALESLAVLRSDYFLYKKDLKNLQFRIYYSLGYIEEAYSVLESLKKYLSGTEDLSPDMRKISNNFVKFAGELLKVRDKGSRKDAEYVKAKILAEPETESADWIIEKLDEI
ncbi:MAG: hypothetical protein K1X85_00845 [Ignavibacteria bacterium]|nr:hypothetical protein [Ignavibacteria bacterium]